MRPADRRTDHRSTDTKCAERRGIQCSNTCSNTRFDLGVRTVLTPGQRQVFKQSGCVQLHPGVLTLDRERWPRPTLMPSSPMHGNTSPVASTASDSPYACSHCGEVITGMTNAPVKPPKPVASPLVRRWIRSAENFVPKLSRSLLPKASPNVQRPLSLA